MGKETKHKELLREAEALLDARAGDIANLANISALYMEKFKPHWVGFYLVRDTELVLGPFQGPVACTRIAFGRGVCGSSWKEKKTIVVDNVHLFPGHIACSPYSNSEIVVPCIRDHEVWAVLDIDSTEFGAFDASDSQTLEQLVKLL